MPMIVVLGRLAAARDLPRGRAEDADAGQLPRRDPHRRLRLLLRDRLVAHHRPDRHVVEPDLGHDDRDADPDVPASSSRSAGPATPTRPIALCVGAIVCIAAANAGGTSQDLKTGYLVGATPIYQQIGLIIGVVDLGARHRLDDALPAPGVRRSARTSLPAPQATLMATIIKGLLSQNLPWGLVLVGVFISVDARAVRHPLAVVRGRLVPADRDDRADLRRRPGARLRRAQDRARRRSRKSAPARCSARA